MFSYQDIKDRQLNKCYWEMGWDNHLKKMRSLLHMFTLNFICIKDLTVKNKSIKVQEEIIEFKKFFRGKKIFLNTKGKSHETND